MWAKTLLEPSELDVRTLLSFDLVYLTMHAVTKPKDISYILQDDKSSSSSSSDSAVSVETSVSSHFGGMNYPSLFCSKSKPKVCKPMKIQFGTLFVTISLLFLYLQESSGPSRNVTPTIGSSFYGSPVWPITYMFQQMT